MRVFLLCALALNLLLGASAFKETRYLYALDKTLTLEGFITFGEENIVIEYTKPNTKVLTYFEDKLSIQDENGYEMIDTQQMPSLHYFFMIIQAVHTQNTPALEMFFETQNGILIPKGVAAEVLEKVEIHYVGDTLHSLHVAMKNGDRIDIEVSD